MLIDEVIWRTMKAPFVDSRDLLEQMLLHLPRIIVNNTIPSGKEMKKEADRLREYVITKRQGYEQWASPPVDVPKNPKQLLLHVTTEEKAKIINEHFHYIFSHRAGGSHYTLETESGKIASYVSASTCDIPHLQQFFDVPLREVAVISRQYTFNGAPKNSISYHLGKVQNCLKQEGMKAIMTYVNPNLGFTGSVYTASNWKLLSAETQPFSATYLDGYYITRRELASRYGTLENAELSHLLGDRFETNRIELKPLLIYGTKFHADK